MGWVGFWLEFEVQIRLKNLVFAQRIEGDVPDAARAEGVIGLLAIGVGEVEGHRIAQRVAGLDGDTFHVHAAVEDVGIDQVWIERELLGMLPEDVDLPVQITTESEDDSADIEECLQSCLQKLSSENRKLILAYYAKEKQAKIDNRNELAQQFGISVQTLRVKVYRLRGSLEDCIVRCLKRKA